MARKSAYSTGFGSYDIAQPEASALAHGGLRFAWGRVGAFGLCLAFWAGVATWACAVLG
ncbi:hypothetical protein [Caulobacter segnis]|uniref:hypothetical protein n=1 Tax=Caulobacter segnis TaxID=88688 RepID=UPI0026C46CE1|nr:hypothetical protein [Caulobacter segnis]